MAVCVRKIHRQLRMSFGHCVWHTVRMTFTIVQFQQAKLSIDRFVCASTMEPIQFWLPVGFFYVLLLFALCPRFFHLHVFIEIHMSLRILIESSEIFLPQELRTTPFERCVESSLTYQFAWKKMIENELSINAENSHRPILEWSIQII